MGYVSSNLAREINRLTGYGLAQGCKENFVERAEDWPGVHSIRALLDGEPLTGHWFSRTQEYAARRRGEAFDPFQYATREILVLSTLPCWKHLSPEAYRERVLGLVNDIDREAAVARANSGQPPLGREAILSEDPHHRPAKIAKSPAPFVHAASKAVRLALYGAYAWFVAAYRGPPVRGSASGPSGRTR
jgi:hypothetical protein